MVILTPIGETLIELILRAYEYNDSYEKMLDIFYEKVLVVDGMKMSLGIKPTAKEIDNNPEFYNKLKGFTSIYLIKDGNLTKSTFMVFVKQP